MHLTDEDLAALLGGRIARGAERDRLDGHLAVCSECAERRGATDPLDAFLADEETWAIVDEAETHRAASPLRDLAESIRAEDEEAERLLAKARVLDSPYKLVWAALHRRRRFRTGGVVRVLTRHAHEACEKHPLHARNLADAAIHIAEALPSSLYPASGVEHLRGGAWKERANACRYLGELRQALEALDRAERAYRRLLSPDLHLAIVNNVRATVLLELERYDEALSLARLAAREFDRLGDTARWADAQQVIGSVHFDCARFGEARAEFARALAVADRLNDPSLRARIENNVANCDIELADFGSASMRLHTALPLFEELGLVTEVARTRWTIACLALRSGNALDAERRLRSARETLVQLRMGSDVAKITLDLVDALLAAGQPHEVPALLSDSLRRFQEAGQLSSVLTATVYLQEQANEGRLTRDLVGLVRRFIDRAERRPDLRFVPPRPIS